MAEMASIADANGGNALMFGYDTASVMQPFDDSFVDAIDAEERAEPKSKQYSTLNHVQQLGRHA